MSASATAAAVIAARLRLLLSLLLQRELLLRSLSVPTGGGLQENRKRYSFWGAFPMFVPSRSWQIFDFQYIVEEKGRHVRTWIRVAASVSCRNRSASAAPSPFSRASLQKRVLL